MDEAAALKQFQEAYRGTKLEVTFYPDCLTSWRWQRGKNGGSEHFKLLAYVVDRARAAGDIANKSRRVPQDPAAFLVGISRRDIRTLFEFL